MKIKLNTSTSIDLPTLIETRLLVQANSGGGKSWAIRRIIEQAFGHVQIIVLDPEGEFTNLRTKFDFIYAGKGGDAPVETRSATLMARRLLELKASAIIDLYELSPQDRKHFVRLFCESLVNAPKELWHDVLVIIDEAHVFAPEKGESEALGAVIDLASRGRKRGYSAILATQRPAKLSKDAAAECNNKLIGRASLDIDRKRAAEELGFTSKEDVLGLRNLHPGEFYVFGPAIGPEVARIKVGNVAVPPAPRGSARSFTAPPPSNKVKKILAELKDLPTEAAQEARTVAELRQENATLKGEVTRLKATKPSQVDPDAIKKLTDKAYDLGVAAVETTMRKEITRLQKQEYETVKKYQTVLDKIAILAGREGMAPKIEPKVISYETFKLPPQRLEMHKAPYTPQPTPDLAPIKLARHTDQTATIAIGKGELIVLAAIAAHEDGMTREHITVQTGYKRSTRDAYIQRLVARSLAELSGEGTIIATAAGREYLGPDYKPLPTGPALAEYHLNTLPEGEAKILRLLLETESPLTREQISDETNFKRSTRDAYIQRLRTRQLINLRGQGMVVVSDYLRP